MNVELSVLIQGIIAIAFVGFGSFYVIIQIKAGKISKKKTSDVINTVEEIMTILEPSVIILAGDNIPAEKIFTALESTMNYARDLVKTGELDRLKLIRFAYSVCEQAGVELGKNEKGIIEGAVALIWMFAKE